jgi:GntR family transcriptional repressor for pyruvate dehydrogenase complex
VPCQLLKLKNAVSIKINIIIIYREKKTMTYYFTGHKTKKGSKKEIIEECLRKLIKDRSLKEGDKLPSERELAQMLNVSRNVLREAIVSLSAKDLVEVRERQGIFVKKLEGYRISDALQNIQNIQMLPADFVLYQLEVRTIISVPAARIAAQRRTDEDIRKLKDCFREFVACPYATLEEQAQSGRWEALLHHLETEAAHNPILSRINESMNAFVERNNLLIHPDLIVEKGWMQHIIEQHRTIIKAIEDKDSKLAGDTLETHMVESVQRMLAKHPELRTQIKSPYWDY